MTTAMKMVWGSFSVCLAFGAAADDPAVSRVTVRQRWPWSRLVDIDYVLSCEPSERMDITVNGYNDSAALAIPPESLSGNYGVTYGANHIVWDPTVTAYTNVGILPKFRVALTATHTPVYMIVDLTKSAGAEGQTEYVYESDLTNGLWGAWVRNPVTNNGTVVESVVWTGVATNDVYKTTKLVLRRIHAGTFGMGNSVNILTKLTKAFYAGVFEVTQRQWELIKGAKPSYFTTDYATRPVEMASYNDVRGATNSVPAVDWPGTGVSVLPSSFIGLLRAKTGLADFDLPTDAQWEYLCRAGTTTDYNDGNSDAKISGSEENNNGNTNSYLNALGRYKFGGGYLADGVTAPAADCGPTNGTAVVGSCQPNAWGLYDTHGNVWEWCLDWSANLVGGSDPVGPVSAGGRVLRGGSWHYPASDCRSANRIGNDPSYRLNSRGFRLVRTLP